LIIFPLIVIKFASPRGTNF